MRSKTMQEASEEAFRHVPGRMSRRTSRLALALTLPGILVVLAVVLLPLIATFWISLKNIELRDLSPPRAQVSDRLRGELNVSGDQATYRITVRIPANEGLVYSNFGFISQWPQDLNILKLDNRCSLIENRLHCEFGDINLGERYSERLELLVTARDDFDANRLAEHKPEVRILGTVPNPMIIKPFT
ncbi:MAG: hypothetical protein ACPGO7_01780, partial [Alphaproteobacteria bacterium]